MTVSDWRDEYRKALLGYVFRNGTVVEEPSTSTFGWIAKDYTEIGKHVARCAPDPVLSIPPDESEWSEFDGTFADPPWAVKYGLDAVITCKCGVIRKRRFRVHESIGEVIAGVLRDS